MPTLYKVNVDAGSPPIMLLNIFGSTPFALIAESDFELDDEEDEAPFEKMNERLLPALKRTGDALPSIA